MNVLCLLHALFLYPVCLYLILFQAEVLRFAQVRIIQCRAALSAIRAFVLHTKLVHAIFLFFQVEVPQPPQVCII